jgi:hypothetical protein
VRTLGSPPDNPSLDWAVLVGSAAAAPGEASAADPMRVLAYHKLTHDVTVSYAPACAATGHEIVYGPLSGIATHQYAGQVCNLGSSGIATFDPGSGNAYWVLAGTAAAFEGSYGRSSSGAQRPEAVAVAACDLPQNLTGACP